MLRILIADDHAIVRQGLRHVLLEEFSDVFISETATGQETLAAVQTELWDALILDIHFPDKNSLEVFKEVKLLRPALSVVSLSFYPEEQYGIRVLKAGGSAYLTKETVAGELVVTISIVLQGGRYISATLAEQLAANLAPHTHGPLHQALPDREMEVLRHSADGKTVADIGDLLSLSVKTISTYRARLLEKLNIKNPVDLIRYAIDHHLAA